jgi:hypothetical protein
VPKIPAVIFGFVLALFAGPVTVSGQSLNEARLFEAAADNDVVVIRRLLARGRTSTRRIATAARR